MPVSSVGKALQDKPPKESEGCRKQQYQGQSRCRDGTGGGAEAGVGQGAEQVQGQLQGAEQEQGWSGGTAGAGVEQGDRAGAGVEQGAEQEQGWGSCRSLGLCWSAEEL